MTGDTSLSGGVACTVEIRLERERLPERMAAMRVWLDERRFEPSGFACHEQLDDLVVSVGFSSTNEAEAFAEQFAGHVAGAAETGPAPAG
jgi:hypothetical protein